MAEYEVDLREYVLIQWKGKWIVAGVLVLALAIAAALTLVTPAQYRAEVLLAMEDLVKMSQPYTRPTAGWTVGRVKGPEVIGRAAASASVPPQWLSEALTAGEGDSSVQLTVEGTRPGVELASLLDGVVAARARIWQ